MATNITSTIPQRPPERRRGDWWPRAGVLAGALVYAALAIGNGGDRLALVRPAVARQVPALFASDALQVIGQADLHRDPRAAVAAAQRLVARAPIEPASTALLGASRLASGDDAGAEAAFQVAGQLGWRVPLTQGYLLGMALDAGDMRVAAQRLDALLRLQPRLLRTPGVLAPFEDDAAAQAALVDRLATDPPWLSWYIGQADGVPAAMLSRRVPALLMLGDRGMVLGCAAIGPAVRELAGAGQGAAAAALERRHCPGG